MSGTGINNIETPRIKLSFAKKNIDVTTKSVKTNVITTTVIEYCLLKLDIPAV